MATVDKFVNVESFGRHFLVTCDPATAMALSWLVGVREVQRRDATKWVVYVDLRYNHDKMREKILRELREERTP